MSKRLTRYQLALHRQILDDPVAFIFNREDVDAAGHWFAMGDGYGYRVNHKSVRALIEAGLLVRQEGRHSYGRMWGIVYYAVG